MVCPIHREALQSVQVPSDYRPPFNRHGYLAGTEECSRYVQTYEDARSALFPYTLDINPGSDVIEEPRPEDRKPICCVRCIGAEMAWLRAHPSPC